MRNVLRIFTVALALTGSATLASAQSTLDHGPVTGTQQNAAREFGTPYRGYHGHYAFMPHYRHRR